MITSPDGLWLRFRGFVLLLCLRQAEAAHAHSAREGLWLDAPSTADGQPQASAAAQAVEEHGPTRIVSSPAARAQETAQILGHALKLEVSTARELIGIGVGSLDGSPRGTVNSAAAQTLRSWLVDLISVVGTARPRALRTKEVHMPSDRAWLSSLGPELKLQREAISALLDLSEASSLVSSLSVGCSIGRGAADVFSDVDAAVGVHAPRGSAGAARVRAVEEAVVALQPRIGTVIDVLRQESDSGDFLIRRVFVQFEDRLQLDLAVVAEEEVRRGDAAPDFVALYWSGWHATTSGPSAYEVSSEQVREWSLLGWRALLDADKYLRRGSVWEAHHRLHEARDRMWMLWAAARGAPYPWHGLSQVLDHEPEFLPSEIEATVVGLDVADLRRAVLASVDVLDRCSASAAEARSARLPTAMARYVRTIVTSD